MTRTSKVTTIGFVIRAFVAQALFWISYLRLPIARSLQLGDGFWFFAEDGPKYLELAKSTAAQGFWGIFLLPPLTPSRFFIELLTLLVVVFGSVASLALLINCAAYALTCAVLVRIGRNDVTVAAIAFSPAALLFSLQLLKDTLFVLLIVLMIASFRQWQESWRSGAGPARLLACAAAMLAVVYALAGIRWYFAMIVWVAAAIFLVLVAWPARRRGWALASGAVLFVLLSQCVRFGPLDMAVPIARALNPATVLEWRPSAATKLLAKARRGFDKTRGATKIGPGPRIADESFADLPTEPTAPGPKTITARLIAGFSATFLPRFLAQSLGLVRVGGGRALWLFAEADTVSFDLVLLYAIVHCTGALRRSTARVTPLFVLLILVFVMLAGPMIYAVSNFGTLFRLRQMLYVIAAVLPITLRITGEPRAPAHTHECRQGIESL